MELLEELQSLYTGYLLKTAQLERDRKPADGLLGMGSGPAADPCHDRFAQELVYDVTAAADLSGYADAGSISGYALAAIQWANAEGIISGTSDTTLTPQGQTTRAQAAAMLMRFCEQ